MRNRFWLYGYIVALSAASLAIGYALLQRWRVVQLRYWFVGLVARTLSVVGLALAFWAGHSLYTSGVFTLGTAYLFVHYSSLLARPKIAFCS